jgi:hypothetical protein
VEKQYASLKSKGDIPNSDYNLYPAIISDGQFNLDRVADGRRNVHRAAA